LDAREFRDGLSWRGYAIAACCLARPNSKVSHDDPACPLGVNIDKDNRPAVFYVRILPEISLPVDRLEKLHSSRDEHA
jgi:hypothetical protein